MDAVTYPNEKVYDFMNKYVISLRVPADQEPLSTDFNVQWTPALLILDHNGQEHHRTVGFMTGEELIASILLGTGNAYFNNSQFQEALACYDSIINQHPDSDSVQEAIFQTGVSRYKSTNDPIPLKEAYQKLNDEYPGSQWAKRAYPYRLIQ
jgi:tetratricopeptide (TPR) repeat protein